MIDQLGSFFPELEKRKDLICKTLQSEETSFNKTLDRGIDLFNREIKDLDKGAQISGSFAFKLYDDDASGYLDDNELKKMLFYIQYGASDKRTKRLIGKFLANSPLSSSDIIIVF